MNDYNTQRDPLVLREYGRNVQKLVNFLKTIEDREKRNKMADTLVGLVKRLTPANKEVAETNQKLWDDMHIMSEFTLDVDAPFPIPEKDVLEKKPEKVGYAQNDIRFKHYGKNIELLINRAIAIEEPEAKASAVQYIGKLMKSFYTTWNKDVVEDDLIIEQIGILSKGKLVIDKENFGGFNTLYKATKKKPYNSKTGSNRNQGFKGRSNNNNRRRRN